MGDRLIAASSAYKRAPADSSEPVLIDALPSIDRDLPDHSGRDDPPTLSRLRGSLRPHVLVAERAVELSRCRGIGDRCKVGRSAGMITVRRDAVRTQGRAPKAGGDQRDHEAVGSSSRLEAHAEVVKCDISATANTLKSQDTPNLLSPISNIRAVTLKLYSRAPSSRVEIRPC